MAAELTRHRSEGARGFLRACVLMVSSDPLIIDIFTLPLSVKPNPDVWALCVI